jgi:tRNA threonylcarbamoyladenosine biosynthesis protein TsaB
MSCIVSIETATGVISVTLSRDGAESASIGPFDGNQHAEQIPVYIQNLLEQSGVLRSEISAVAISAGPGSYTGLRIGAGFAKGLCTALSVPLIAVNTLEALALSVIQDYPQYADKLFCPMLDARRMEVYGAVYNSHLECLIRPQPIIIEKGRYPGMLDDASLVFFGNGSSKCKSQFENPQAIFIPERFNHSKDIAQLAHKKFLKSDFEDLHAFEPEYLKDFVPGKGSVNV